MLNSILNNKVIAALTLIATVLSALSGVLGAVDPQYAVIATAVSGAISAFLTKLVPVSSK